MIARLLDAYYTHFFAFGGHMHQKRVERRLNEAGFGDASGRGKLLSVS